MTLQKFARRALLGLLLLAGVLVCVGAVAQQRPRIKAIKAFGDGNRVKTVVTISYDGDGVRECEVNLVYYRSTGDGWEKLGDEGSNTAQVAKGNDGEIDWF